MPVEAHAGHPPPSSSRSSHVVTSNTEVVHPVVSYKIGYFKHVCTSNVFKHLNKLRRTLEAGADWSSLEAVNELHKMLVDCTTQPNESTTIPGSSCSQADTETPQSSPRSSVERLDCMEARFYPLADVAVQVDTCFDDTDEYNLSLPIIDIDGGANEHKVTEDSPSARDADSTKVSTLSQSCSSPLPAWRRGQQDRTIHSFSPSRSFWMVTEESRVRIRELETTVELLNSEQEDAKQRVIELQAHLDLALSHLQGRSILNRSPETTIKQMEARPSPRPSPPATPPRSPAKERLLAGPSPHARRTTTPVAGTAAVNETTNAPRTPRAVAKCSSWLIDPKPEAARVVVVQAGATANDVDLDEEKSQFVEAPKRLFAF